jgi:squalene-hopene/tetraprenyl-beta-curcumene cyclase
MVSLEFLRNVRQALLDRRVSTGQWEGRLSSSALATATAVTALAAAIRAGGALTETARLVDAGVGWLLATVNEDGGWGDTPASPSNISTTALAWSALAFSARADAAFAAGRAEAWMTRAAGGPAPAQLAEALASRYGKDRTFSVPILTACAIAGRLGPGPQAWRLIPQLPFEVALIPRRFFGTIRLPVVSYALPALIAMGIARHRQARGADPLRMVRDRAINRVLGLLTRLQPDGGGFLEAVPLTSFVAMSLSAAGEARHPVVTRGLEFLVRSVRPDGSWAIDSNLATWVTTLSINALAPAGAGCGIDADCLREWLLRQQWMKEHPYTGAAPGGWAWTDLPGGVPDADDTAGALVALAHLGLDCPDVRDAAAAGVGWLLGLQNRDGGIPTFCRGWGALPFDRSSTDITAHALRAWAAWYSAVDPLLRSRIRRAAVRAQGFLARNQRSDGAFVPLWFGNQQAPHEENPVYGTSRVIVGLAGATAVWKPQAPDTIGRAVRWLTAAQHASGGWGGGPDVAPSLEETGAAVSALAAVAPDAATSAAVMRGLEWLSAATDEGRTFAPAPLGLYFARLWYAEDLYPVVFTAAAVEAAAQIPSLKFGQFSLEDHTRG